MNKSVVIIGAGGHGKVIADIVLSSGDIVAGFLDDRCKEKSICGFPMLGRISNYKKYKDYSMFIVAIGNAEIRQKIVLELFDVRWYTAIHPTAIISRIETNIGYGTAIMANAVINPGTSIGNHCIINTGAVVEHDNVIEDYVHISVGAKLAGTVYVCKYTWIGIGAVVSNNLKICESCVVRAGATVVENIEKSGIYQGIPAKIKE